MTESEKIESLERAFLADFTTSHVVARKYARHYGITGEMFHRVEYRDLWQRFEKMSDDEEPQKYGIVAYDALGLKDIKAQNDFLDLQSKAEVYIERRASDLALHRYVVNLRAIANRTIQIGLNTQNANEVLLNVVTSLKAVPLPPVMGTEQEKLYAQTILGDKEPEMPDALLHVPGFIDDLVAYSLAVARKPNRVLSFAGALAMASHLMGRRFKGPNDTCPNLYVVAVAPTGAGKEAPRRVNNSVLMSCEGLLGTLQNNIVSGEALEDILFAHPSTLAQIDEFQNTVRALNDKKDVRQLGIAQKLLNFFTSSGTVYKMRTLATKPEEAGRIICDPSLTLFGTGVLHLFYESLTPQMVEEGLLGRCLIFDTAYNAPQRLVDEDDGDTAQPSLPTELLAAVEDMAYSGDCQGLKTGMPKPIEVPFSKDARKRFNAAIRTCEMKQNASEEANDHVGAAIWARASEKISKLALIHAVSATRTEPVITPEGVEWAEQLVHVVITRMCKRFAEGSADPVSKLADEMLNFIAQKKGRVSLRDITNHFRRKEGDAKKRNEAIDQLVQCGKIEKMNERNNTFDLRLINGKKN